MKREILFKAKRVDNGEWVEGGYHKVSDDVTLIIHKHYNNLAMNSEVYPETVCQFTGLLDKNGNKIFEGDILKWIGTTGENDGVEFHNEVYFLSYRYRIKGSKNGKTFHTDLNSNHIFNHKCEIIGNTFDNR